MKKFSNISKPLYNQTKFSLRARYKYSKELDFNPTRLNKISSTNTYNTYDTLRTITITRGRKILFSSLKNTVNKFSAICDNRPLKFKMVTIYLNK